MKMKTSRLRFCAWLVLLLSLTAPMQALAQQTLAQQTLAQGGSEKAAAEALFQQARKLLRKGETKTACAKFAASQELDPSVGTLLFLGDCYEKLGRVASAWAAFGEAGSLAENKGDKRKKIANLRAIALKPRVTQLTLKVAEANRQLEGFAVRRDGIELPLAAWGTPLPMDARTYTFEASARGQKTWSRDVAIEDGGDTVVVDVPKLESAQDSGSGKLVDGGTGTTPAAKEGMSTMAVAGLATGGVGVVSMIVGGVFGGLAKSANDESLEPANCSTENLCSQAGLDLREQAQSRATISTVTFILGGVLAAGGATLFVLSSSSDAEGESAPAAGAGAWRFGASVAPGGAGLNFRRTW
jgi:hypothetical protein